MLRALQGRRLLRVRHTGECWKGLGTQGRVQVAAGWVPSDFHRTLHVCCASERLAAQLLPEPYVHHRWTFVGSDWTSMRILSPPIAHWFYGFLTPACRTSPPSFAQAEMEAELAELALMQQAGIHTDVKPLGRREVRREGGLEERGEPVGGPWAPRGRGAWQESSWQPHHQ